VQREARAASALDHPKICSIYQLGEHEGQPFIVMQLLEGQTLREWIETAASQDAASRVKSLVDFAIQITDGLEAAHEKGIIHRDIKPANIFITSRGQVKILDFGVAKFADTAESLDKKGSVEVGGERGVTALADPNLTRTGASVGTPSYLSPEQIRREKLDTRTDLFSFGLVLYEMATGHRAFPGNTVTVIRDAVLHRPVEPMCSQNPELPPALEDIVNKALTKDREQRYQSAVEIQADLQLLKRSVSQENEIEIKNRSAAAHTAAPATRFWVVAGVAIAVIVAVSMGVLFRYRKAQAANLTDKDTICCRCDRVAWE
jgi:serine/threonine protein kinase